MAIYRNTVGKELKVTVNDTTGGVIDMATATSPKFHLRAPGAATSVITPTVTSQYLVVALDSTHIATEGTYQGQVEFTLSGWRGRTSTLSFEVKRYYE